MQARVPVQEGNRTEGEVRVWVQMQLKANDCKRTKAGVENGRRTRAQARVSNRVWVRPEDEMHSYFAASADTAAWVAELG
jgi:hypothetical protein